MITITIIESSEQQTHSPSLPCEPRAQEDFYVQMSCWSMARPLAPRGMVLLSAPLSVSVLLFSPCSFLSLPLSSSPSPSSSSLSFSVCLSASGSASLSLGIWYVYLRVRYLYVAARIMLYTMNL